jgi:hypothetical protein
MSLCRLVAGVDLEHLLQAIAFFDRIADDGREPQPSRLTLGELLYGLDEELSGCGSVALLDR